MSFSAHHEPSSGLRQVPRAVPRLGFRPGGAGTGTSWALPCDGRVARCRRREAGAGVRPPGAAENEPGRGRRGADRGQGAGRNRTGVGGVRGWPRPRRNLPATATNATRHRRPRSSCRHRRSCAGREWEANEALRRKATYDARVERIVVHHTATWPSDLDFPAHVRKIYENEIASGYRDIAYHLLIDPNGVIYEGRWARNVEAGETPDGENSRGRSIRGGHARRNNDRTLGFAIIGDYSGVSPTDPGDRVARPRARVEVRAVESRSARADLGARRRRNRDHAADDRRPRRPACHRVPRRTHHRALAASSATAPRQ